MKIMISWLHKNGKARAWTSSKDACESVVMSTVALDTAISQYSENKKISIEKAKTEVMEKINKYICNIH